MERRPYRPSNGTEGDIFYANWCRYCVGERGRRLDPEDGEGCMIYLRTMAYDVDDPQYPKEWLEDEGSPCCAAYSEDGDVPAPLDPNAVVRPLL